MNAPLQPPPQDTHARLRRMGATLWAAFIGAAPIMLLWLRDVPAEPSLGDLSVMFFGAWAVALVPAAVAMMLARSAHEDV